MLHFHMVQVNILGFMLSLLKHLIVADSGTKNVYQLISDTSAKMNLDVYH